MIRRFRANRLLSVCLCLCGVGLGLMLLSLGNYRVFGQIPPVNPPAGPTVQFSAANYYVAQDAGSATITVTLSESPTEEVSVNYSTSDGTATSPTNYESTSGSFTFYPGNTSATFQVSFSSFSWTQDITINLTLSNPTNATLGSPSTAVLTIAAPNTSVQFSAANYYVAQDAGMATITVTLSESPSVEVSVNYSTSDGTATNPTNYESTSGSFTFYPGNTSATFQVYFNSFSWTQDITINLTLSDPIYATLGDPSTAILTITAPNNSVQFSAVNYYVAQDAGSATITVTLAESPSEEVSVNYSTSDGTATSPTDYESASGSFTFYPGNASATFTVYFNGFSYTQDITINLTLSNAINATLGNPNPAILTITAPSTSAQFSAANYYVAQDAGSATITVTLSESPSEEVSVNYSTSDGTATSPTDYQSTSGTLTFYPGNTSATFSVYINSFSFTQDVTVNLTLSNAINTALGDPSTAVLTITAPNVNSVQFDSSGYAVDQSDTATIAVVLSESPTESVSVAYATSDGTAQGGVDYTPTSGTLTFPPGTTSQSFTVSTISNPSGPSSSTVNLTLSSPSNATLGAPSTAVLTLINDQTCP